MAKDPAFLFYSQDFYTGVATLNWEDRGKYITILCLMHQQGRMSEETIRFILGSVSDSLKSKFSIDQDGLWYNDRLEQETEKRNRFTESRRLNGNLGGRPKDEKASGKPKVKPKNNLSDNHKGNLMGNEDENESVNELLIRKESFQKEVFEFGKDTYTGQMLENFVAYWSQPSGKKALNMLFEKERDSKAWDLNLRLKKWANNNFDKIPCYLTELKSISDKKGELTTLLAAYVDKYPRDILNSFYRHWSQPENKPVPTKLRWEDEEHWDLAARLKSWSESKFNKTEETKYFIPKDR